MRQTLPPPPVQSHLAPPVSTAGGERRVRDRWRRRRAAGLADAGMLALGGAAAVLAAPASAVSRDGMWWALAYLLGTLVVLELRGFYDFRLHRSPRRGATLVRNAGRRRRRDRIRRVVVGGGRSLRP